MRRALRRHSRTGAEGPQGGGRQQEPGRAAGCGLGLGSKGKGRKPSEENESPSMTFFFRDFLRLVVDRWCAEGVRFYDLGRAELPRNL